MEHSTASDADQFSVTGGRRPRVSRTRLNNPKPNTFPYYSNTLNLPYYSNPPHNLPYYSNPPHNLPYYSNPLNLSHNSASSGRRPPLEHPTIANNPRRINSNQAVPSGGGRPSSSISHPGSPVVGLDIVSFLALWTLIAASVGVICDGSFHFYEMYKNLTHEHKFQTWSAVCTLLAFLAGVGVIHWGFYVFIVRYVKRNHRIS